MHSSTSLAAPPFDTSLFRDYVLFLLQTVLGALPGELLSLFDDEFKDTATQFAAESGGGVYVVKVKKDTDG